MKRIALLVAIGVLATAASVSAQTSNTYQATRGLYQNDVDRFLSVTDFTLTKDSLVFIGGNDASQLEAGAGYRLGWLYLAGYYNGYALKGNSGQQDKTTVQTTPNVNTNTGVISGTTKTTTVASSSNDVSTSNTGTMLIGLGPVGINLSVYQGGTTSPGKYDISGNTPAFSATSWTSLATTTTSANDQTTTTYGADGTTVVANSATKYTNGNNVTNSLKPSATVGALLSLGGLVLKPYVGVTVAFSNTDFTQSYETYTQAVASSYPTYNGTSSVSSDTTKTYNNKADSLNLTANGGLAAELTLEKKDVFTVSGNYSFTNNGYNSAYTDAKGGSATVTGKAWDFASTVYSYNKDNTTTTVTKAYEATKYDYNNSQAIGASTQYTVPVSEQLSLSTTLSGTVDLIGYSQSVSGQAIKTATYTDLVNSLNNTTTVTTQTYTGATTVYTSTSIRPSLWGAVQYLAVKDLLTLNLGMGVSNFAAYYSSSTQTTQPGITTVSATTTKGDGTITSTSYSSNLSSARSESSSYMNYWGAVTKTVSGGATLQLGNGFAIDALMNVNGTTLANGGFVVQLLYSK